MKKILLVFLAGTTLLFGGCFGIWDFVNYDIVMLVSDEDGNDLIDPRFEGNILGDGITIIYDGQVYELNTDAASSRANMAFWEGFRYNYNGYTGNHELRFGEFDTTGDFHGESFTVDWSDGTTDTVSFDLYITWNIFNKPTVHKKIRLNGEVRSKDELTVAIVK